MANASYPPDLLRGILERSRLIAMVGASSERWRPCFGIMAYLQRSGYRVVPVNPTHAGETLHGERVVASLAAIPDRIDLVNVFRRAEALPGIVEEAVGAGAGAVWAQLGIRSEAAAERAETAGMAFVMDRCISVEHGRLMR